MLRERENRARESRERTFSSAEGLDRLLRSQAVLSALHDQSKRGIDAITRLGLLLRDHLRVFGWLIGRVSARRTNREDWTNVEKWFGRETRTTDTENSLETQRERGHQGEKKKGVGHPLALSPLVKMVRGSFFLNPFPSCVLRVDRPCRRAQRRRRRR